MREGRSWRTVGCTALASAAIAFPAGWWLSGRTSEAVRPAEASRPAPARPAPSRGLRDMYTARPLSDPAVVREHLKVVEAMERGCRLLNEGCAEAQAARRYIDGKLAAD